RDVQGRRRELSINVSTAEEARASARAYGLATIEDVIVPGPELVPIGCFSNLRLTVAQIISVLGCIGAVVSTLWVVLSSHESSGWLILSLLIGFCGFFYSAAMYLVFAQVKQGMWR